MRFLVTVELEVEANDEADARYMAESDDWLVKDIVRVDRLEEAR